MTILSLHNRLKRIEKAILPIFNAYQDLTREDITSIAYRCMTNRISKIRDKYMGERDANSIEELAELLVQDLEHSLIELKHMSALEIIREGEKFWENHPTGTLRWEIERRRIDRANIDGSIGIRPEDRKLFADRDKLFDATVKIDKGVSKQEIVAFLLNRDSE